ncbi:MAG: hypothetical protein ACR2P9_06430 [Gammaproteobacteria bacterium]
MKEYKKGMRITVNDAYQKSYVYTLAGNPGKNFYPDFTPYLTPQQMLEHGVFEGKYINDSRNEFPAEWYVKARLSDVPDVGKNYFGVKSRQPLSVWRERGWIIGDDPRGWFQWYCRYYLGRRDPAVDEKQIKRWKAFRRHAGQIIANCKKRDLSCRPRQRQALLQWAYDPFI